MQPPNNECFTEPPGNRTFDLAYWINERESIKLRKASGMAPPWTSSDVMATTRWCNVHREDDAVTQWMRKYWSTKDSPVWWFVLGRMINWVPTLADIVEYGVAGADEDSRGPDALPDPDGIRDGLKALKEDGRKIFTSAYTISTCGQRMDKVDYVMGVVGAVQRLDPKPRGVAYDAHLIAMHAWLQQVKGLGSFLAAQVVADMKNTEGHPLQNAEDWWTWAAPGPGSLRGLAAYYGRPSTPRTFAKDLKQVMLEVQPHLAVYVQPMCAQDWQNCCCEFSKYIKLREGKGHARNRYHPRAANGVAALQP